ncbi:hypothetical protein [Methylibium sp.]|uniref:hypothetical protein n=1 Tax=Methylibium sp. TaxID=2067992 RepID=UPI003D1401FA
MTHAQHFARDPVHRSDQLFQSVEIAKLAAPEPMPVPTVTDSSWGDFDAASGEDEPTYRVVRSQQTRTGRNDAPVVRVRAALARLSRDRWLHPREVSEYAHRLAGHCSRRPCWTADNAYPMECAGVGMLRGRPPAFRADKDYAAFVAALRRCTRPELQILLLTVKGMPHGS